jgi:hypothetical protein
MKRGAGYLALLVFLVTGLRFASGPAAVKESPEVRAAERAAPSPRTPVRADSTCKAFEYSASGTGTAEAPTQDPENGGIAAVVDRFLYGSAAESHLASGTLPEGIRVIVVSIPDPLHTHLSLQFDRTLEALQQAAQDERYTYDSSWLPWRAKGAEFSSMTDRKAEARETAQREACPGVVLFRRNMFLDTPKDCKIGASGSPRPGDAPYQCGLFVFVVGENPTAGLNRMQWDNAMRWISQHTSRTRDDKALRVLGPTFSGSMPSFVRALEDANQYAGTFTSTLLYTGRIRGCASWYWLKTQLNPPVGTSPPTTVRLPVRVADFEENDSLQSDRLYRYLKDRGHKLAEIAIISEDETAYGGLPDSRTAALTPGNPSTSPCVPEYSYSDRPLRLYYPRDISAIRSAYQEQSIFSSSKTDSSSQPHTVLQPESGSSRNDESDTIAPFSGNNLALTQEAQLYGIVNLLKTHGIRYIVLRSTNSLDYLFLTRFLHRAYPMAFIVTMGSDLLFGREIDSTEFRGVAALSSFPLLPRGQDWTRQTEAVPNHSHRVFGSFTMEGAYLAGRFLMSDPGATIEEVNSPEPFVHPAKADIPDYALPFWDRPPGDESQPATWLSVIGRDGYWPLATLTEQLGTTPRFSNLAVVRKKTSETTDSFDTPLPQRLTLSSSWRFFCVLALLVCGMHYFACRYGWNRQNLGMFVQFTRLRGLRGPSLIAAGWSAICSLLLILFLTSARIYSLLDAMDKVWVAAMGLAAAAACVLAVLELKWWSEPLTAPQAEGNAEKIARTNGGKAFQRRFFPFITTLMFGAIGIFGAAGLAIFEYQPNSASGVTAAYRSVHLTSGVSPVVSLISMLAGFYWWFWQSLSGLALLGDGRPTLPRQSAMPTRFSQVSDKSAKGIDEAAIPFPQFGKSTWLLYLLPLLLVLLLAVVLQKAWAQAFDLVLHSLENAAFNRTLHVLIAIALYLILLESIQFYSTWLVLKRLLMALDRLPLRRTFAALQGLSMRSLWRMSGTSSRARYKVFSHQLGSLLRLRNELDAQESLNSGTVAVRQSVRKTWETGMSFVEKRSAGKDFAMVNDKDAKSIRHTFCECSEVVLNDLLIPAWQGERGSVSVQEGPAGGEEHGPVREHITLSDKMPVRLGEEFLCVIYVGYLQNLLGRMRTMVLSMVGIFAAIAIAVGFYPFTPRPIISLSLLFLLLLIGTIVGVVFAGLDRDSTLSHITNTQPGALGAHFWLRMISFVGVPAMGLIVAQFPEITDFVFSWIEPTMSAIK